MEKKSIYEPAEVEIQRLKGTDVIATSGWSFDGDNGSDTDSGGWT